MSQDGQYIHDFNLDFLETICATTGNNYDKIDKQKNSVLLTKKKIIATSDLLKKYYDKKNALQQAEKSLQDSRLECKQVCLDKKSAQDKVTILEERERNLIKKSREWEERYLQAANQYEAMKSHANQLQLLVDQSEEKLEKKQLKHDEEIERYKDLHKNNQFSYKERKLLHRHIYILKDIVLGRKKLTKAARNLLEKYKLPENHSDDDIEDYNWIEDDTLEEEDTDFIVADDKEKLKLVQIKDDDLLLPDDNGLHSPESDCNEITSSVDTGFGTLISTSDSEKCLKSPDYFSGDSPIPTENSKKSSVTIKKADTATSPIKLLLTRDVATSPIHFEKVSVESSVPVTSPTRPKKTKRSLFDEDISEDEFEYDNYTEITTNTETKYPINEIENHQQQKIQEEQTKMPDHNDEEVELIINTMKRKFDMLLPLPPSPNPLTHYVQVEQHSCEEAAKIRKDNEIMKSTIASLAKEVCEIKSLLQAQKPVDANNVTLNSHSNVTAELVPDPVSSNIHPHVKGNKQSDCFLINENPVIKVTEIIEFENDECSSIDRNENCDIPDNSELTKIVKKRKLSKLEKMRANLAPKPKIKPVGILSKTITKRLRNISNHSSITNSTPNKLETSKSLNDKAAYEKAVAVMKARNNKELKRDIIKTRLQQKSVSEPDECLEKCPDVPCQNIADNSCAKDEKASEITSNSINNSFESVNDALRQDSNVIKTPTESNIFVSPRTTRSKLKEIERSIKIAETKTEFGQKDSATKVERKLKRPSIEEPNIRPKRILRSNSSSVSNDNVENLNGDNNFTPQPHTELSVTTSISNNALPTAKDKNNANRDNSPVATHKENMTTSAEVNKKATCYSDLDLFDNKDDPEQVEKKCDGTEKSSPLILYPTITQPGDSILCKMIKKYGIAKYKQSPKITETINEKICKTIEDGVERISHLAPIKVNEAMNELVDELKLFKYKQVLSGLIAYFRKPERKTDLFNKTTIPPVPPMSKNEQILLYVIGKLKDFWPGVDIVDELLRNIEYALFRLNNTPELDTIEVMSHFYAVVCRYIRAKSRLRMFMLDAMYCLSFKAIPVVRQSLEVWMHVLPLAHMAAARIPLVICVIYLLHFFKCLDYGNKVYELRNILQKKYSYKITEWNEKELLEMFRNAIMELRDKPIEKKMLRIALIILSKRQGPRWCEKNVIQGLLLPIIDKQEVPERIRQFCVLMMGPLMRPFPNDMKVHCEIGLNKLFDMREKNLSANMEEAVFTSLVYMVKHDQARVNRALLTWQPQTISEDLEKVLCEYVKEKPIKTWKNLLGKVYRCDN